MFQLGTTQTLPLYSHGPCASAEHTLHVKREVARRLDKEQILQRAVELARAAPKGKPLSSAGDAVVADQPGGLSRTFGP